MRRFRRIEPGYVELGASGVALLTKAPWLGGVSSGQNFAGTAASLTPVTPSKIICIGRNYRAHAQELGNAVPAEPLLFFKPPSALLDPGGVVRLPPESSRVEFEAELAVVIGKRTRRVPAERALDHVFGFTIACDITARDLQRKDGQWTRAKGFDTFCPVGREVTTDVDVRELSIRLFQNDELRQDGNTRDMVFGVPELIAYVSNVMTLEPGDLLLTGTPEGVGPIATGDRIRIEIETLGRLEFTVE